MPAVHLFIAENEEVPLPREGEIIMWITHVRAFSGISNATATLGANLITQSTLLIGEGPIIVWPVRRKEAVLKSTGLRARVTVAVLAFGAIAVSSLISAERGHSATNARSEKPETAQEGGELPVASPDKTNAAESYTRRYQVGGFELDVGFTPDKAECVFGEPVFVTFSAKNLSDKPYGFFVGGDIRGSVRHNNFRITAVDADGQPVKDPYSYDHFGGPGNDVVLESGESYTERLYLGFWCAFDKPGVYDVRCERTLTADGLEPKYSPAPIVTTFKLNILPFDREKVRAVIAGLGKKLREGDQQAVYEATLALSEIDDEAVIPHLTVSLTKGDFQNRLPAVKGLSRFSTDVAADALIIALKDPDYVVGEAAGEALRKNKMANRAVDTLLERLRNVQSSVRASAARGLGYTGSERALDPLIKAMDDPTPAVGQAAAEALGKLGHKEAIEPLRKRVEGPVMDLRVAAAKGLQEPVEPLAEVIKSTTDINDQNFHESIRLIRLYGGERAAPALVGCLQFDDPSPKNQYNLFLILAIEYSPNGPKYYSKFYHDPNTDGTPEQIKGNRQILDALRAWLAQAEPKR
jgi:HEAT repeat protein